MFFLLLINVAVMLFPISRKDFYYSLKNDCIGHASWIYDRIFENSKEIDVAFIGSSHTLCGIDDNRIETSLENLNVANLGYCRHGRNLDYLFASELIAHKKPQILVVEVRKAENPFSHPVFPHLADNQNLITNYPFFNPNLARDLSTAFQNKLQLIQESLFKDTDTTLPSTKPHGFTEYNDTIAPDNLLKPSTSKYLKPEWKVDFDHTFPLHYDMKLSQLCRENNIKLLFLYIPDFTEAQLEPIKKDELSKLGEILMPPSEIFTNPNHWHDPNHLNITGAQELSDWVALELKEFCSL